MKWPTREENKRNTHTIRASWDPSNLLDHEMPQTMEEIHAKELENKPHAGKEMSTTIDLSSELDPSQLRRVIRLEGDFSKEEIDRLTEQFTNAKMPLPKSSLPNLNHVDMKSLLQQVGKPGPLTSVNANIEYGPDGIATFLVTVTERDADGKITYQGPPPGSSLMGQTTTYEADTAIGKMHTVGLVTELQEGWDRVRREEDEEFGKFVDSTIDGAPVGFKVLYDEAMKGMANLDQLIGHSRVPYAERQRWMRMQVALRDIIRLQEPTKTEAASPMVISVVRATLEDAVRRLQALHTDLSGGYSITVDEARRISDLISNLRSIGVGSLPELKHSLNEGFAKAKAEGFEGSRADYVQHMHPDLQITEYDAEGNIIYQGPLRIIN